MLRHTDFFSFICYFLLFIIVTTSSSSLKFITKNTKLFSYQSSPCVTATSTSTMWRHTCCTSGFHLEHISLLYSFTVFFFFFYFIFRVCHKSHTFHLISHTHLRRKRSFFCRFSFDFGKVITDILYLYTIEVVFSCPLGGSTYFFLSFSILI